MILALKAVSKLGTIVGMSFLTACASSPESGSESSPKNKASSHDSAPVVVEVANAHDEKAALDQKNAASLENKPTPKLSLEKVRRKSAAELDSKPTVPLAIFDRIIAKVLDENLDDALLKSQVEEATGAKVFQIRRAALGVRLIQFVALNPPRDKAGQKKLAEALQGLSSLKYAEGERWMTPKAAAEK